MNIIEVKSVYKKFRGVTLFEGASAEFNHGEIHGIIGPNGSGKSVFFKMICGFIQPDQGTITIDPTYRSKAHGFPDNFGIIIDRPGYIAGKTGFANLQRLAAIQDKITDEDIVKTMKRVGLQPEAKQKVKNYSLGMKQKLALAQAIMEDQQVLILDEPFNALDKDSVTSVRQLLLDLKAQGKTIIMTSHQENDIELLCDKVYRIDQYKLEEVERKMPT
ncbi:ATP-binding cassette domain-containing protein [Aureibacillus halotolerans]|uniref:ABC-2 type transport system ATP-binding protein n=1 Tax=Aureibacillus halotolerans TaxID=1508390 RepID=A0A4V3D519_9BACI|nr:ATP-binding cassette domain-containing protein [Aureibacillus halotolerans]TDQ38367.1 ABC-2 type transport system ATP-binding protein [Aureibacillus halotolerans]